MNWNTLKEAKTKLALEEGTIFKDWGGRNSVALIYPNSYFLGMSNLGFQALYRLLNGYDQIVCERVFHEKNEPVSLESQRPLSDFDVLAFSFSYEQDYFNAVRLLKSSGIPPFAADRDERHPLIIAGGAAVTANPEPLASIIDCFAIGEGEAVLPRVIPVLLNGLESHRYELLNDLAGVPGLYVPAVGNKSVRQFPADIGNFPTGSVVLTPDTELGDMYLMEIVFHSIIAAGNHRNPDDNILRFLNGENFLEVIKYQIIRLPGQFLMLVRVHVFKVHLQKINMF